MPPESRALPETDPDPTYYLRMFRVEQDHWWYKGMRAISMALLEERLKRPIRRLLDVGCGAGGFLRWALDSGICQEACGIDVSPVALRLARDTVPGASVQLARLGALPFRDRSFDLVVTNDVLQHASREEASRGLREIRRVLHHEGTLLVRTNGARRGWALPGDEWRVYDVREMARTIEEAGFRCERVTYANAAGAVWGLVTGRRPRGPTAAGVGIPNPSSPFANWMGGLLLSLEARYVSRPGRILPYGHTIFALASVGEPAREERVA